MKMRIFKYLVLFLGIIFLEDALMLDHLHEQNIMLVELLNEPCEQEEKEEISEQEIDEFIHYTEMNTLSESYVLCTSNLHLNTHASLTSGPESPPPERKQRLF